MGQGSRDTAQPCSWRVQTHLHTHTNLRKGAGGGKGEERPVFGCIITDVHTKRQLVCRSVQIRSIFSCTKTRGGENLASGRHANKMGPSGVQQGVQQACTFLRNS